MANRKRYHIGIDTGKVTGFASWDRKEARILQQLSGNFWDAFFMCLEYPASETEVTVEDPGLIKRTFRDNRQVNPAEQRKWEKITKDVGKVSREADLLIIGLERIGYKVNRRKPSGKKWNQADYELITGRKNKTNEHVRDATRFVFQN